MKVLDTKVGMVLALGVVGIASVYLIKDSVGNAAADVGQAVNPLNPDNVFASGVDAIGANLSGNENWSLGGWIYDIVNPKTTKDIWTNNPNR